MSPKHIIYKKLSRDKSVSVYFSLVCVSDGVVLVDPEQVKGKKGETRSQTDGSADTITVLTDMSFYFEWVCVVISENVCVFSQFPDNLPCSVCLQPGPTDRCAVEFEVKAFCAENQDEKAQKSIYIVRLAIRKIQYAPDKGSAAPSAETTCEFIMSDKPLHMRVSLEKETFYHGEEINISVDIDNSSNRNIKDLSVSVEQVTNVVLYSNDKYIKTVACEETMDTVPSGTSLKKVYTGSYILCVCKMLSCVCFSEVAVEVPFKLMHPKPDPGDEDTTDLVFEEFKRSYLKGVIGDDDESLAEP
uniref:S-antigen; retina and pineal gland (arrestin) b n=1 Tax=Cyprinus carpio TaxID=7962 RepID=A0A8C1PNX8_CYPCA